MEATPIEATDPDRNGRVGARPEPSAPAPSGSSRRWIEAAGLALPALAFGVAAFACRGLFRSVPDPHSHEAVESFFFAPDESFPPLAVAIASWLLWNRRVRLRSARGGGSPLAVAALLAVGTASFLWSQLVGVEWLVLPTLACAVWAYGCGTGGRAGGRAVFLPGLVLLMAVPLPVPLRNEIVWQLQQWTALGSAWLLQASGRSVARGGVLLEMVGYRFVVIEDCSGARGIWTLALVAVAVRELFRSSGPLQWLVVIFAVPLGYALNVVRVSWVVSSENPELVLVDHTPQGVAVLVAGTVLLYAFGGLLAHARSPRRKPAAARESGRRAPQTLRVWGYALAWWSALALVSVVGPSFDAPPPPPRLVLPEQRAGWTSEPITPGPRFHGALPARQIVSRRYTRPHPNGRTEVVELFATYAVYDNLASLRLFSGKIEVPERDWTTDERRDVRIWELGMDAEMTIASRPLGSERALVYVLRFREDGLWRESLRSLLGWERTPFARRPPKAVVRLSTPLGVAGAADAERARKTLDRFVSDFGAELTALASNGGAARARSDRDDGRLARE